MENILEIKNLTKNYSSFTLDNISFALPFQYVMGFVGENGAGKSTTIKLILDLIKRDGGEIKIFGKPLEEIGKSAKENIGVVLDETNFPENLNARDVNLILKSTFKTHDSEKFFSYIKRFEIGEKKKIKEYSRGMKMKLGIAAAISHDCKLLILDEATSGLDPFVREEVLEVFREFANQSGHAVFISSHIVSDLEKICDGITFIHKGKIVFSQSKDAIMSAYSSYGDSIEDIMLGLAKELK